MTYCYGEDCPLKENCRRWLKEELGRRNTFTRIPYNPLTQTCEQFWEVYHPTQQDLETNAYYIWQREGCPTGKALEHWLKAKQVLSPP